MNYKSGRRWLIVPGPIGLSYGSKRSFTRSGGRHDQEGDLISINRGQLLSANCLLADLIANKFVDGCDNCQWSWSRSSLESNKVLDCRVLASRLLSNDWRPSVEASNSIAFCSPLALANFPLSKTNSFSIFELFALNKFELLFELNCEWNGAALRLFTVS